MGLKKGAMRELLEYWALRGLLGISRVLPIRWVYAITAAIAALLWRLDAKRRRITIQNIQNALGLDEAQARALGRRTYGQLSKTAAEILLLFTGRFDFGAIDKEELKKLAGLETPAIFLTAHIGNWEALAQLMPQEGYAMGGVGRAGNNRLIERHITTPFRNRYGNFLIHKHKAAKELIRALKGGKNVGLLLDQRGGKQGIWVEFFGRKASTLPTAHTLQKRFGAPIVPIFLVREGERLRVRVAEPIECAGCDEAEHTRKINEAYEKIIQDYPDQWFWMHERWRG